MPIGRPSLLLVMSLKLLGKRELRPYPLAKLVKVSNKLLRIAAITPSSLFVRGWR